MPNWVYNSLLIEGEPEVVARIREQVSAPYETQHLDWQTNEVRVEKVEQPFSFWNIIKPTDLDAYHDKPNGKQDGHDHWYNWNLRNWGVKWDAKSAEIHEDDGSLCYTFETPWGVPACVLLELSRQHPTARIELEYEEENGWGGTVIFDNGTEETTEEYDAKCRQCGALETMDYCETCDVNVCSECNYAEFRPEIMCETHKEKETVNG
jgi:hypothetical protein